MWALIPGIAVIKYLFNKFYLIYIFIYNIIIFSSTLILYVFSGFANSNIQQHVELFAATRVPVPTKYEYDQEEYENENQYQFPTQNHMQKQRPEAVLCHFHREDYKNL